MNLSRHFRSIAAIFQPPFEGLWLVALLYYTWCYLVYPNAPILRGDLPDTDDYMYLNQVLDWMSGQGWYDNFQHRLNPPDGAPIHFSRLAQLPMAGIIYMLERLGLGSKGAGTLMAGFYPLMLLGAFFTSMRWLAQSFMPKDWSGVTAFVALFAAGAMFMFQPGHIDHHGLILVFLALTLGCVMRMFESPEVFRWGLYAGLLMALALTVALEVLPSLLLISGWIGLWAIARGGNAARNGLVYGLTLYIGSVVCLIITRPPAEFFTFDVLTYSAVYVILTGAIAATFAAIAVAAYGPAPMRWIAGVALAAITGYLFLQRFPDLIAGPYGGMDPALAQIILGEINEAQPLKLDANNWFTVSRAIAYPAVALLANAYFLFRARGSECWRWSLSLILLMAAIGLAVFYQRRFIGEMAMMSIVPLSVLLQRGWAMIGERYRGRPRVYAEIALLMLVGPLPAVIYPALADGRRFNTGVVLFPASISHDAGACEMFNLERILRDPVYYGDRSRLIMSTIDNGPELLFRTNHKILAAPFHMDVEGNVDATRFFSTPYPDEAEAIARRRHVDLVVACRYIPEIYLRPSPSKMLAHGDSVKDFAPHMITRLMTGKTPPWLKQVNIPGLENFVIYEVVPSASGGTSTAKPK